MVKYLTNRKMTVPRSVALALFVAVLELPAASLRALPDGYTRRVWQTQDGLPENTVQAFAQTSDNYLWIGTSGGLVRFDGAVCLPSLRSGRFFNSCGIHSGCSITARDMSTT